MSTAGVGTQDIEEVRESRHGDGVERFDVAHITPMLGPSVAVATFQVCVELG